MQPDVHLIIHNVICVISVITLIGMAVFTYLNGPRKIANLTWTLMLVAITVFVSSHVIGVNIADPYLSRSILMWNISIFFIGAFNMHAVLAVTGKDRRSKWFLISIYLSVALFTIFFIFKPDLFLVPSVSKMYFPSYYTPGIFNWVRVAFLYGLMLPYMVYTLFSSYIKAEPEAEKKQYLYLMWTISIGYAVGYLPNLLIYDVQFDPAVGMLFVNLFAIPFVFGAVKYKLFNVKVIAQQAFWYSIAVAIIGGLITTFNYSTEILRSDFPNFPMWTTSIASAILVVTVAVFVWYELRKADILKYEFITTVTHKFRTPLTHIKWASENLDASKLPADGQLQINYIKTANLKLVELTNLLMNVSESEAGDTDDHTERVDLASLAEEVATSIEAEFSSKNIRVKRTITPHLHAHVDKSRVRFVMQTFMENAIHYTRANPEIAISVEVDGSMVRCSVTDNGIGLSADEIPFLFSKFYRGHNARLADTEGMGICLFMSKEIISRYHGRIWAESEGEGRGSTFSFTVPLTLDQ